MLSVHPTTVSASAVGSSTVMDQSVETEDQQSGIQSETQTQASQDSGAAVRASQNGWVKAGDSGWYFYENGQLKTGWLYRNGNWYWLDPDRNGRMAENSWFTYDNNLYYAKGDGAIYKNGFQEVDGNLYYFQSWGGIQRNVYLSISGKMYYVQENGIVARGIVRTMNGHGDLCAFDDTTGAQITQKGWLKKGTSYYWVREDGVLQTGWLLYDDNWYWFDDNGVMMTSGWKEINNNLYYFRSWGGIYKNGFQSIGGNEYYFQSWGGVYRNTFFTVKGKTYIAQNDGSIYHASQTGWVQLGDQTYWINQDGSVQTGWLKLEGKWYWLKADGTRAASEWITYDNNRYYFDGDGVMYTGMKEVDGARYYFHSWGGVYHNESFTWQGKKYAIIGKRSPGVLYYNTTMLKNAAVAKAPAQLAQENKWTWKDLKDMARRLTVDKNKDGKPDVYGFGTELEFIFPLAQGTDIVKFKNGNPSLNIDDETWRSSLLYYYDGINKDKVFSPVRWGMWEEFANGNVAMYYGPAGEAEKLLNKGMKNWDIAPFPKANSGDASYIGYSSSDGFGVPAGAKNAIGGIAFGEYQLLHQEIGGRHLQENFHRGPAEDNGFAGKPHHLAVRLRHGGQLLPVLRQLHAEKWRFQRLDGGNAAHLAEKFG